MERTDALTRRSFIRRAALFAVAAGQVTAPARSSAQRAPASAGVLDIHAHMPLSKYGNPLAGRFSRTNDRSTEEEKAFAEAVLSDGFEAIAAIRIRDMDRWGVAKSVVMPMDFGQVDDATHRAEAEAVSAICREHEDRLIPFLATDPRRRGILDYLEYARSDLGIKGVKIHPLAGFAIDDQDACYPFYKRCSELELPVLGHCRPTGNAERDRLARPERYERVAADFPELRICLGHLGGGPWTEDALRVVENHPNAYGDVSNMQPLFVDEPERFAGVLRRAMNGAARERVMYATDWPSQRPADPSFLEAFAAGAVLGLSETESSLLTVRNAERFLGV